MDKHFFVKKYWKEGNVLYYFHFLNSYAVRQIEITSKRILRFSLVENDILCDQPLTVIEHLSNTNFISEQEFEDIWNNQTLRNGVEFIKYGDIFSLENVTSFAHGCNCAGAMGRGVAVQFKKRFPMMFQEYYQLCKNREFQPGDVFDYDYGKGHVYNLGTQKTWRSKAKIDYLISALEKMMESAEHENVETIALPAICSGLGGLRWTDVKRTIKDIARYHPKIYLYVVENFCDENH